MEGEGWTMGMGRKSSHVCLIEQTKEILQDAKQFLLTGQESSMVQVYPSLRIRTDIFEKLFGGGRDLVFPLVLLEEGPKIHGGNGKAT